MPRTAETVAWRSHRGLAGTASSARRHPRPENLPGICLLLREAASCLPERLPRFGARPSQHARRERRVAESRGFFCLSSDRGSRVENGRDRLRRKRSLHRRKVPSERLDTTGANGKRSYELLGSVAERGLTRRSESLFQRSRRATPSVSLQCESRRPHRRSGPSADKCRTEGLRSELRAG